MGKIRILIVDDHILFREGLIAFIHSEPDLEVVGQAGSIQEAVGLVGLLKPDLVLMDFELPDGTGVDATRAILMADPTCKIVILAMSEENEDLLSAIRSGAQGYVLKSIHPSKLVNTIKSVQGGEIAISRSMTLQLLVGFAGNPTTDPPPPNIHKQEEKGRIKVARRENSVNNPSNPESPKLTERELEILKQLAEGKTNQEIASRLYLSENTVKHHTHNIFEKLGISSRTDAITLARQINLAFGMLAGDSTTDAPPPDVNKKKKRKGSKKL